MMNMKEFYLLFSIFIGVIICIEGYLLYQLQGRIARTKTVLIISTVEFVWALLSYYVLFYVSFSKLEMMIPVSFATYSMIGWLYSFVYLSKVKVVNIEDITGLQIPRWYVLFVLNFSIIFTIASSVIYLDV